MNIVFRDEVGGGGGCKYPIDQEGEKEGREGGKFFACLYEYSI